MVELDTEGELTRAEVAQFLREFADELEKALGTGRGGPGRDDATEEAMSQPARGDSRQGLTELEERRDDRREDGPDAESRNLKRVTLIVGGDSATVSVPPTVEFDVEVESRSPMLSSGVKQGIDFNLSWTVDNPDELNEEWLEVE